VLFVIVTLAVPLAVWSSTPPPTNDAELPLNVLLLMVRLAIPLLPLFPIAPPVVAAFPIERAVDDNQARNGHRLRLRC